MMPFSPPVRSRSEKNGIRAWPLSERPREVLLSKGVRALSDADLVAVLLRTGTDKLDAVSLARSLIKHYGSLTNLLHASPSELKERKGLGPAKVATLAAVIEIAKRYANESVIGKDCLNSAEDVYSYLITSMRGLKREVFKVIFLDNSNRILAVEDVAQGTVDESVVYPREVISRALANNASALIFAHNHPSGRLDPTLSDLELTRRLFRACETVDLRPLDHIIIADNKYMSIADKI